MRRAGPTEAKLTILLAAIFAGLSYPVYRWVLGRLRGRKALAAIATLVLLLVLVMAPLLAVLGAGANEALRVSKTIRPRLEQLVDQPGEFDSRLRALPGSQARFPFNAYAAPCRHCGTHASIPLGKSSIDG